MTNISSVPAKCHCGQEFNVPEVQGYEYCPNCGCMYSIDQIRRQIGKLESCAMPKDTDGEDIWDSYYTELLTEGHVHKMQGEMAKIKGNNEKAKVEYSEAVALFKRAEKQKPTEEEPKRLIAEVSSQLSHINGDGSKLGHAKNKDTKSGGCFIATAAFGTSMAPEVLYLQHYRNSVLSMSKHGRAFINAYYMISPPIARAISKSIVLKTLTRFLFLKPLINILRYLHPAQSESSSK